MGHFPVAKSATREGSQISSKRDVHHRFGGLACFWLGTACTPVVAYVIPISRLLGNVGSGLKEGVIGPWRYPNRNNHI